MASQKKRPVTLTAADRQELIAVVTTGVHPASMIRRARVLLALDTSAGEVEARLIALACSAPPAGHARWSLRLLEKHVALTRDIPDMDHSTIGRVLKKRSFVLT